MADNALYRKKAGGPVGEVEQINVTVDPSTGDMVTGGDINGRDIAADGTQLDNNTTNISTNATNIGNNTSSIGTNATNIGNNTSSISTNATNIGNNTSSIGTNATNIGNNATNIGNNTSSIGTNATNIGNNTSAIGTNATNIGNNTSSIGTNATNIGNNATNIGNNTSESAAIRTTQGTANGDTHLGTFTGDTISDNSPVKTALQELETAVESISVGAGGDTVKVSANDTTAGVLEDKVIKGPGIVRNVLNEGTNEQLQFELGPHYKALASSGLYTGAVLSVGGAQGTFSITSGEGLYIDSTTDFSNIQVNAVIIAGQTDVAVTNIATQPVTYILIDQSGNIVQNTTFPTATERRNHIFIGVVVHSDNTNVIVVNNIPSVALDVTGQLQDLFNALGFFNQNGNVISPNGANLSINKSAGTAFKAGANFQNNSKDPHTLTLASQTSATFRYRNQDSSEGINTTVIDPTSYDLGGTTTAIPGNNNQATLQRIYVFPSNLIRVQYGQEVFQNLSEAVAAAGKEAFVTEPNIQENGLLLGTLAVTKGATDLSDDSQALFFNASRFGELGSVGSSAIGTLQDTYNNSIPNPEILTSDANGSVTLRRGTTGGDSDIVLEIQNNTGTLTFSIDGNGNVVLSGTVDGRDIDADGTQLDSNTTNIGTNTSNISELTLNQNDLITLSGVPENSTTLGTFTGATISDNTDVKSALQELETQVEAQDVSSTAILEDGSNPFTGNQSMGTNRLTDLAAPVNDNDAARKTDVDAAAAGVLPKDPVRVATTADVGGSYVTGTITGLGASLNIDGAALVADDRVLLKDQTDAKQNGIYVYDGVDELTRSEDMDGTPTSEVKGGNTVFINNGNTYTDNMFRLDGTGELTLDVDDLVWVFFSRAESVTASTGLIKVGLDIQIEDAAKSNGISVTGGAISAEVDNTSIEISANNIGVKNGGITESKFGSDVDADTFQLSTGYAPAAGTPAIGDTIEVALEKTVGNVSTNATNIGNNATNIGTNSTNIGNNATDISEIRTTQGTSDGDTNLGTFTGATISDNNTVKGSLQELETAVESNDTDISNLQSSKLDADVTIETPPVGSYTLVDADSGKHKRIDGTLVIPTGLTVGKQFAIYQINATKQPITTTGVTVEGNAEANMTGNGLIGVLVTAANTVLIKGETEA